MSRLLVDGWQVVIGIETHAQIRSRQKLFSRASTALLSHPPNTRYNVFDAAFPGTLPRLNEKCIDLALRAAIALDCTVRSRSFFDRKHYFYSDQPAGYQITQHYAPFALDGHLNLAKLSRSVRIKQVQLEQDTGKSIFYPRTQSSLIDLNRAGTGLLEIVTEPDLTSPEEAAEYVRSLQALLRAIHVSDGNMEAGSLRCDVNISINRPGEPPGTRCEIKNLNSVKFMVAAINHEVQRQRNILTALNATKVPQETRGFDQDRWETFKMRSKEDAPDYRYMPDPNLGVLVIHKERIEQIRESLPSLPDATRARLISTYGHQGVTENNIDVLMGLDANREVGYDGEESTALEDSEMSIVQVPIMSAVAYFEYLCAGGRNPKVVMNWIIQNLLGQLSALEMSFTTKQIPVEQLGELIDLVASGQMTRPSGKLLLRHILTRDASAPTSVKQLAIEMDLISSNTQEASALSPDAELHDTCVRAMDALPSEMAAIRAGNKNVMNKVVGWVMRETKGKADVKKVKVIIDNLLREP